MEHVGVGQKGGLKLRLEAMRTAFREHFFVADKQIIPEAEEFCLDLPCSQIHPGLCAHRDAAIYCKVLQMSKSLEHFVCRRHLDSSGKVYEIQADHNDINPMLVFISHKRSRRLHVQISVVFAGVGCRAGGQLFFEPRRLPDGRFENKFHFSTVWHIAHEYVGRGVERLVCRRIQFNADFVLQSRAALHPLHPLPALPRSSKTMTALDRLTDAKPKRSKAQGSKHGAVKVQRIPVGLNIPGPQLPADVGIPVRVGGDGMDGGIDGLDDADDASSEGSDHVPNAPEVQHDDVDPHWANKGELQLERFGSEIVLYYRSSTHLYIPAVQRSPVGRLMGPFGGANKAQSQLSWSISCSNTLCGGGCRLVKSNRQLKNEPRHLIRWLLSSFRPEAAEALRAQTGAHKWMWRDPS